MTKNNSIKKVIFSIGIVLSFIVSVFTPAFASNIIPAEVVSVSEPINVSDTSYTQQVIIRFPSENQNRTEEIIFNYPNSRIKEPLKKGDHITVKVDSNAPSKYEVISYDRVSDIIWLPIIFIAFYIVVIGARFLKRIILQLVFMALLIASLYVGVLINHISIAILVGSILAGIIYVGIRFRRPSLILIASLSFAMTIVVLYITSFFLIDILKLQDTLVGPLLSFYNYNTTISPSSLVIASILIASSGGILAVISYEVREGVTQKARDKEIERNKLIIKAAKTGVKTLQEKAFSFFALITGILALLVVPFITAAGISSTLNVDAIANIISFLFLVLLGWFITVPVTALIAGFILGRTPSHKLVSADILDEFEGVI